MRTRFDPRGPETEGPPTDSTTLREWAAARGVAHVLDEPAGVLADDVLGHEASWLGYGGYHRTVGMVAVGDFGSRLPYRLRLDTLREAAWKYLQEAADAIPRLLEQERLIEEEWRAAPPRDSILRLAGEMLRAARAALRARGLMPRIRVQGGTIGFVPEPVPTFVYREGTSLVLEIRLPPLEKAPHPLMAVCSCPAGYRAGQLRMGPLECAHLLTALDLSIAALRGTDAERIAKELGTPRWTRLLDGLSSIAAKSATKKLEADDCQISWRIREEYGSLQVHPYLHRRKKRGDGFTAGTKISATELPKIGGATPVDLSVASRLAANRSAAWNTHYDEGMESVILALCGHPRVFLERPGAPLVPMAVYEGSLTLSVERESAGESLRLRPMLDGKPYDARAILEQVRESGSNHLVTLDVDEGRCGVARVTPEQRQAVELIARFGDEMPADAAGELLARIPALQRIAQVAVGETLRGQEVPAAGKLVLRLRAFDSVGIEISIRVRPIDGGVSHVPGEGLRETYALRRGATVFARRDLAAESERARSLVESLRIPTDRQTQPFRFVLEQGQEGLEALVRIEELAEAGTVVVEWANTRRTIRKTSAGNLRVRIERRQDWFGIDGEAEIDGEKVQLAVLVDAARRGEKFVPVGEGAWLHLSELLQERLQAVADHTFAGKHGLEVSSAAARAVNDLAADGARFDAVPAWVDLVSRMKQAEGTSFGLPDGLAMPLRAYQAEGFRWLKRLSTWGAGACLADDMGLGKTAQTLALLLDRAPIGPALVLAPTSVCANWKREAQRFAPDLKVVLYRDVKDAERDSLLEGLRPGTCLVVSYGLLVRDADRFASHPFATLVLDEAQALKNARTRRATAARGIQAAFRVALSGTPMENHLGELWSLFRVVFPALLGSFERFRDRFAVPIEKHGDVDQRKALARLLRPFLLRRRKDEVAKELPPRTEVIVSITPSSAERRIYEDARIAALAKLAVPGMEDQRFEVLAEITRLRLLACHPRLQDPASQVASSKLERALVILDEVRLEGHRALVFSQFTRHLALLREALDQRGIEYLYLDGSTVASTRDELVRRFQSGEPALFLISLKAGGTGLNLTGADYVLHLDPWWNPAVEDQASDRAHRIGQTRPVTVLRLVSEGTIEDRILALHASKRALAAGLLEGSDVGAKLSSEEILDLIRGEGVSGGDEGEDLGDQEVRGPE